MNPGGSNQYHELPFKLLKWFCNPHFHHDIEGDLIELYERRIQKKGRKKAKLLLYKDVLLLFRPGIIRPISFSKTNRQKIMMKYHFTMALRTFNKYRVSFAINIIGLSSALVCSLFIAIWVINEWKIDRFHTNGQQLYQVLVNYTSNRGIETSASTPALLTKAIKKEIPGVEYTTTINNNGIRSRGILSYNNKQIEVKGLFASKDFFQVFSYPLLAGSSKNPLNAPNTIVITKDMALNFFGSLQNVIGKTLKAKRHLYGSNYTITGIVENPPSYSTQQFDFIINYESVFENESWVNEWGGDGAKTFIVLKEGSHHKKIEDQLNKLLASKPDRENNGLLLQKFSNVYLWGKYENGKVVGGRISYVRLFSIVGILILIIAAINFINLSTAQATRKIKQIGVQKSMGIHRSNLVAQYLSESVLLCIISFAVALIICAALLPQINALSGKQLSIQLGWGFWLMVALFVAGLGLAAGIYPAIYLSKLSTLNCLKGKIMNSFGELWMRRGMVSMQFSVSIVFIIGVLIINQQINYINNTDLGYDREHVINFYLGGDYNRQTFITELEQIPGVLKASNIAGGNILDMNGSGSGFSWGGKVSEEEIKFNRPHIGYQFFETLDIEILEGRPFSSEFQNESEKLIINEAAAEIIGDPDIVGKSIMDGELPKQVIGIAKNFKIRSLHEALQPCIMRFWPNGSSYMVRLSPGHEQESLAAIEDLYQRFEPDYPFNYRFLDEDFQTLYLAENRVASLSKYFTILAIIISALGLFGLASFTLAKRAKEISVRKVLGSTTSRLIRLFSTEFTKTILISALIAIPIAYLLIEKWISNFAYQITLEWWLFLLPTLTVFLLFGSIIGILTHKAANVNPVNNLRTE